MKMKKLIPALCMLLISALLLGTSTYAWFSMNTTVSATGMEVKAMSNATYLLIGDATDVGTSAADLQAAALTTDAGHFSGNGETFYPADRTTTQIDDGATPTPAVYVAANNWYTCNNGATNVSTGSEKNYKTLTEVVSTDAGYATSEFSDYVLANTFYLALTADSEAWTEALKVTVDETDANACVKTIVKIAGNYYEFDTDDDVTINNIGLDATTPVRVDVFTFIDGTTTNVYTDFSTIASLAGSIELQFDLVANV